MSPTDSPFDEQMLCVSIHDVAPATWTDCLRLVEAVRAVADIPLTWLVVPHYHFRPEQSPAMEACLNVALERGDELALHGYSHLDTEAGSGGLRARFLRNVYTRREGEFAALTEAEARRRLELGLDWFAARGWTPTGFVPPAWLLGEGAWRALRDAPFAYTTTFSHFHCLPGGRVHRPDGRPPRRHAADAADDARSGYRSDPGARAQYGSGTLQSGQGNQSGHGNGNRQFDESNWTGAARTDTRRSAPGHDAPVALQDLNRTRPHLPDPEPGSAPDSRLDSRSDSRSDSQPDSWSDSQPHPAVPHSPVTHNNRRGTHAILSPSLVYAARNRSGRFLSPRVADATAAMLARSPLVRFSLHPPDARYPELVRHIQHVLERLLERREAVTKAEFARRLTGRLPGHAPADPAGKSGNRLTSMDPTSHPASDRDPSRSNPEAARSSADRTLHQG